MSNQADIIVRLIAKDEGLREALKAAGKDGEKALTQIDRATKKAKPGLKAVDNVAKDLKASANGLLDRLGPVGSGLKGLGPIGFGAAAGLGAIVAGYIALTRWGAQAAKSIAQIADNAETVGLSAAKYQVYAAAAREASISEADFMSALKQGNKTTAEAALGTGELYSNLSQINPELIKQVQVANTLEDRLKAVSALYKAAGNEVERDTILMRTFGDNGIRVGKILLDGADNIKEFTDRARRMGLVLSDDLILAAKEAATEIELADLRIERSKQRLGVALSDFSADQKTKFANLMVFFSNLKMGKPLEDQVTALKTQANELYLEIQKIESLGLPKGGHRKRTYENKQSQLQEIEAEIAAKEKLAKANAALVKSEDEAKASTEGLTNLKAKMTALTREAETASERQAAALQGLNAAREAGLVKSDAEYNRLKAHILEKHKDVDAIRAQAKAAQDAQKAADDLARAMAKGVDVRAGLSDEQLRAAGIIQKVAARQKELTDLVKQSALTSAEAAIALKDYRESLDGTAQAKQTLSQALADLLSPVEKFKQETQALADAQALANLPAADYNRLLEARAAALAKLKQEESRQGEREQFGETLDNAQKRILDSLKTSEQVIDEKVALQKKILEALGTKITPEQSKEFLKKYREDLENANGETDDFAQTLQSLNSIFADGKVTGEEWGQLLTSVIGDVVSALSEGADSASGFMGIFSQIFGGSSGAGFGSGLVAGEGGLGSILSGVFHSGTDSVGGAPKHTRAMPAAVFAGAPRYHSGVNMASDERPAILQTGERVVDRGDNRLLSQFLSTWSRAFSSASVPAQAAGGGINLVIKNYGEPVKAETEDQGTDAAGDRQIMLQLMRVVDKRVPYALTQKPAENVLKQRYGVGRAISGSG